MNKKNTSTVYDIAQKAGVSPATVSRVINHPEQVSRTTVQKVVTAMKELDCDIDTYRSSLPAKTAAGTRKQKKRGLIFVLSAPYLSNYFFTDIIDGAQAAAQKNGHLLLTNTTPFNPYTIDAFLSILKRHNIAGLLTTEPLPREILYKINHFFPVVQCSEYQSEAADISYVSVDDFQMAYQAADFFITQGYRHIGFLTTTMRDHGYAQRRYQGYARALTDARLTPNPQWILQIPEVKLEISYPQIERFLRTNAPEALLCVSDIFAAAAIKCAEPLALRIPEQLAVIGIDDIPLAQTTSPALSTVRQPRYQLGYTALELLLKEIEHPSSPKQRIILDTELILRNSTRSI